MDENQRGALATPQDIPLHLIVLPTPFPVGPVNVYLAEGRELTLIDTGPRTDETLVALRQGLAEHGYTLADLRRIIVTHAHIDHFGLVPDIRAESGAQVYTHRRNREWLANYDTERERRFEFYRRVFHCAGVPEEVAQRILETNRHVMRYASQSPVDGLLDDGDVLALSGDDWQVLHTPGHSGGAICLYQPQRRLLISGDHLLRDITSNPLVEPPLLGENGRRRSLVEYLDSLARVARLEVDVALPGHGQPITDHRALIAERFAFHETRKAHILRVMDGETLTIHHISNRIFPKLSTLDSFLAISEVLGHLDVLEDEGRVVSSRQNGVMYYRAVKVE